MGKRIIPRARGKGGPRYRAPSHRYFGRVEYIDASIVDAAAGGSKRIVGKVKDIVDDVGRSAPVAIVRFEDGKEILHIAAEGLKVGDDVVYCNDGSVASDALKKVGNVLSLGAIPVGTKVFAIETHPRSGPKLCRSGGSFAFVMGKVGDVVHCQFPSGKVCRFNENCRASIGVPAGGGRLEKPFVKAGHAHYAFMARGKLYPRTRGVAQTATDHPYGGKSHRPRPSRSVSRTAPPGAKIGSISPKPKRGKRRSKAVVSEASK